jgi:hypothetical protein
MDMQQLFETWAPPDSVWSRWAKPALFAETAASTVIPGVIPGAGPGLPETPPPPASPREETRLRVLEDTATAFILDLPGAQSVELGLALARAGYRPVPLFNTADHPAAVVSVRPILDQLKAGAEEVRRLPSRPGAPPAFLLDSGRGAGLPGPGKFDNRWIVFPQDFPSATFLVSQGVRRVVLLQPRTPADQPQEDLAHVLRRWQEAGVEIYLQDPSIDEPPRPLTVQRPSSFRNLAYRAFALFGLKRNSAGGFGSIIPVPSASGGSGFG